MRGLSGKSAIVTGGGQGIGAAIVQRLAEEGANVGVYDIHAENAESTAAEVRNAGGKAYAVQVDLTDHDAVSEAIRATHADHGLNIVINNAGWDQFIPFVDTTPDFWSKVIDINYRAPLSVLHTAIPLLVGAGGGRVVTIASDAGRGGSSGEAVYSGCKAGLMALSKSLAREHSRHNISFNVVCPGPTETPLFNGFMEEVSNPDKLREAFRRSVPMGRLGEAADLPGAVVFFASDDAAYITGQVLSVSGGLTMIG
jgi:2-hydroxycyclohexanecarboxyl-CoA dehydrogenase